MTPEPTLPLTGGCTCGAVRFEISEPLLGSMICHCKRCQRRTGTAFSVSALTAPGSFRLVSGEEVLETYVPDGGWHKSFCRACGGHVSASNPENPGAIGVRMGAFDDDPGIRPMLHQFTAYAVAWLPIPDDGLPRFPERIPAYEPPAD